MQVTPLNYHSLEVMREYMTNSQLKKWLECPASMKAQLEGTYKPEPNDAMLVGSYVDKVLTNPGELKAFLEQNKEVMCNKDGSLKATFKSADAMIARILAESAYQEFDRITEKQVVMEGEIGGVKFLYMSDYQISDTENPKVFDLKTTASFDDKWTIANGKNIKLSWVDAGGYWRQLAIGRHLFQQNYGVTPICGIIGIQRPSKTGGAIGLRLENMRNEFRFLREIAHIEDVLPQVMAYKNGESEAIRCEKCEYCLSSSSLAVQFVCDGQGREFTEN